MIQISHLSYKSARINCILPSYEQDTRDDVHNIIKQINSFIIVSPKIWRVTTKLKKGSWKPISNCKIVQMADDSPAKLVLCSKVDPSVPIPKIIALRKKVVLIGRKQEADM